MGDVERVAKAMYEAPDPDTGETSVWPPKHPEDRAWWLAIAEAAIGAING